MIELPISGSSGASLRQLGDQEFAADAEYRLNLQTLSFATPELLVTLAMAIDRAVEVGARFEITAPSSTDIANYVVRSHAVSKAPELALVGFNRINEHDVSSSMIPVSNLRTDQDVNVAASELNPLFEALVGEQAAAFGPITEAFSEFSNNAIEHGGHPLGCYVAAQRYPRSNRLSLVVADAGIGIPDHLGGAQGLEMVDHDLIAHAMKQQVSGTDRADRGFGFTWVTEYISEAAEHRGTICVKSAEGTVIRNVNSDGIQEYGYPSVRTKGTTVLVDLVQT